MKQRIIKFNHFLIFAKFFYISIGVEPYDKAYGGNRFLSLFLDIFFLINVINMNFVFLSELGYVVEAIYNGNNFAEATMTLSYAGFVFVGDIKILSIYFQKKRLTELIAQLNDIYPHDEETRIKEVKPRVKQPFQLKYDIYEQQDYDAYGFFWRYHYIALPFALIHLILEWFYNLFAVVNVWLYDAPRILSYHCWVPWEWYGHWSYHLLYASQDLAGHTCMMGQLANDLLLCSVVQQIIMHYQYLAKRITEYEPIAGSIESKNAVQGGAAAIENNDIQFLQYAVDYHQRILALTNIMNEVFGISLLMNFMTSAFTMCFLGFQMTIGAEAAALFMLFLFIFCSLIQAYVLTNYGNDLILASQSIGHAVFNHEWFNATIRYKKMLVLIIQRSQRPAVMKATSFLNISLGTMTDLIQLSYKFFALLRTMYSK